MSWKKLSKFPFAIYSWANRYRVKCLDPGKRLRQVQNSFCEDLRVELVLEMERENVFKRPSFWVWNTAYESCDVLHFDFLSYQKYITYDQMSDWHNWLVLICQYYQLFWSDKMFISKILYFIKERWRSPCPFTMLFNTEHAHEFFSIVSF